MPDSLIAAIGHEWKGLIVSSGFRRGGARSLIMNLMVIAAFGFLVPWRWGFDFFDAFVLLAYSAIAFLFAVSAITALMTPEGSQGTIPARVLATGLHGWSVMLITVVLGIATVNIANQAPRFLHPRWTLVTACLIFGLAGSIMIASVGALLAVLFTPAVSRNVLRVAFVALLLGSNFGRGYLPGAWQLAIEQQLTTPGITHIAWIGALFAAATGAVIIAALAKAGAPPAQP